MQDVFFLAKEASDTIQAPHSSPFNHNSACYSYLVVVHFDAWGHRHLALWGQHAAFVRIVQEDQHFTFHISATWKKIDHFKPLMEEILCRWINCPGLIHARLTRAYPPVVWKQRRYANFCRWMSAWQDLARHHHGDQASSLCPRVSKGRNLNNNPGALCFLCLRRLPVYSRRAMWKTAGYSMLPFKIFIEIYQIMYKHRIKIYRNIYQKDHCKAVVKLRRQTWQASDSQRYSKRQCRQCIQFRQCRLQSQELRKTCIISCENWSAAKQSHLLGSHFAFHYPVLTFSWFLSQSNTSWIVLEWSWKVFWNPNIPSGGDVIFWRALQGAWLGIDPMATWKPP